MPTPEELFELQQRAGLCLELARLIYGPTADGKDIEDFALDFMYMPPGRVDAHLQMARLQWPKYMTPEVGSEIVVASRFERI